MKRPSLIAAVFCAAIGLLYFSLSPGSIAGMGYMAEEMSATDALLRNATTPLTGKPALRVEWPRNGVVDLAFHVPFVVAAKLFFPADFQWKDRFVSAEPVLLTALLLTIVFVWTAALARGWSRALLLSLVLAFCTLMWPYAYIGLEVLQSAALMTAAYLALQSRQARGWRHSILFALAAAVALSAKSTGAFLLPAVLFLIWCEFEAPLRAAASRREARARLAITLAIIGAVFLTNSYFRAFHWQIYGGSREFISFWLIEDPASLLINVTGFFGSPNKGLAVFAPVCLLALVALPRAFASHRRLAWFALLTLVGLTGGFSLLRNWSDETWGPRYLHAAIAPLVLCYAAAAGDRITRGRWAASLAVAASLGFVISSLGALFYYGSLHGVIGKAGQSTLEALQGDPIWNHYRFNARLLGIWVSRLGDPPSPYLWTPSHQWFFVKPDGAAPWIPVDLAPYAHPHASLFRDWDHRPLRRVYLGSGIAGAALIIGTIWLARREDARAASARRETG